MTVGVAGTVAGGSVQAEVEVSKALRVALAPGYIGSAGGRYRMSVHSNLLTAISALTATGDVGQIAQFRWGSTTKTCFIDRIEISMQSVTDAAALP